MTSARSSQIAHCSACGFLAARPSADVGVGLQDRVDGRLRQPEQQPVGLPEQRVVVGVRASAGQVGGQRNAVATLVERVNGAAHRHVIEDVQPHALMHQHTAMMRAAEHAGVTPCYSEENSWPDERLASVALRLEPLDRPVDFGLGFLAARPVGGLDVFAGLQVLVVDEEVLDRLELERRDVAKSLMWSQRTSPAGTHSTLSSPPASSVI